MKKILIAGLTAVVAGCAPGGQAAGPAPRASADVTAGDTVQRWLRPVPTTQAYRRAVEAGTRSATGAPGPRYWQNSVSYRIQAELDPRSAELRGRERVVWRNRSPDTLSTMVLNLYQNVFTETARRNRVAPNTGGVTLERVAVGGTALAAQPAARVGVTRARADAPVGYAVEGTLARVVLPRPVAPGDSAVLEIEWRHRVPPAGTFRTAYEDALGGRAFNVAQWYPQVAVYDDLAGWDATPYLGDGEFYLEWGDFDVSITLPAGWIVGATGTLANADEVLSAQTRARLERAASSDSVVHVVTEADLASKAGVARPTGSLTWRFRAEQVRDFAFATSDRYLWDAARASVPGSVAGAPARPVVIHSYYRPGAAGWDRAWRYGQHSIEFFSRRIIPYLYPQMTIAEGPIGGMEYPMLVFIPRSGTAEALHGVIAHEVGHEWFPMMIGQDEAAYAWMDEGVTSFHEDLAAADFFPGSDPRLANQQTYLDVAGRDNEVPLMRHTDLVSPYGARTIAAYTKPAALMVALRNVMGPERFDQAMRTYAHEWLLKHPTPWDFFATFERVAGRDLDWFWYPWWFETGVLDHAIVSVESVEGGVNVVVRDLGQAPMPTFVAVTSENGVTVEGEIPIETWVGERRRTATVALPAGGRVTRVEIDPRRLFPDVDRSNNVWTPATGTAGASSPD